jgi:hypothetical protein
MYVGESSLGGSALNFDVAPAGTGDAGWAVGAFAGILHPVARGETARSGGASARSDYSAIGSNPGPVQSGRASGIGGSEHSGFALGSAGAFLVIESKAHAQARGAKPYARLTNVVADLARRKHPGDVTVTLEKLWSKLGKLENQGAIITGATGAEPVTSEERAFLGKHPDFAVRATGTMFGHTMETQFPLGLGLAALSISRGALFPPNDPTGLEVEMSGPPTQIVVIGTGHWRGEGMALVEAIK